MTTSHIDNYPSILKHYAPLQDKNNKSKYKVLCERATAIQPSLIQDIKANFLPNPSVDYGVILTQCLNKEPLSCLNVPINIWVVDANTRNQSFTKAFNDIDPDSITRKQYTALCTCCIAQNADLLVKVDFEKLENPEKDYDNLCVIASKLNISIVVPHLADLGIEAVRKILNEALGQKKWDIVKQICEMDTPNKPAEANMEQILNKATSEGLWKEACAMQKEFQIPHTAGPIKKSFYTYQLESVTRELLNGSDFSIKKEMGHDIITIKRQAYDLTEILRYANLDHIHLEKRDFDLYSTYIASPTYPHDNQYQSTLLQTEEDAYRKKIYQDQSLTDPILSFQEMQAINIATAGLSHDLNEMLRGTYLYSNKVQSKAAIIQLVMCASGLSKIPETALENSYFFPQFSIQNHAVKNNVVKFSEILPISETETGSQSPTSPPQKVRVQLIGAKVKNITALSKDPEKTHYVLPPIQVEITDYDHLPSQTRFQATVTADVRDNAPLIVQDPDAMMKTAANIYMPDEAYFDMCSTCLKQNPNLLMWVRATKFQPESREARYEQLCRDALQENPKALSWVKSEDLSDAHYVELCEACLAKDISLLKEVKPEKFQGRGYVAFCKQQIKKFPSVIQHVRVKSVSEEAYNELKAFALQSEQELFESWKAIIKNDPEQLKDVPPAAFSDKKFYERLCTQATQQQATTLQYANPDYLSEETYYQLSHDCIEENPSVLKDIHSAKFQGTMPFKQLCAEAIVKAQTTSLSEEDYLKLCTLSISQDPLLLIEVRADRFIDPKSYEALCIQAIIGDQQSIIPILNRLDKPTLNNILRDAIANRQWSAVKIICDMDSPNRPDMATLEEISSNLANAEKWQELYDLTQVFQKENYQLTAGPAIKSFYTYQLEHIFRALLNGAKFKVKRVDDEEIIIIENEAPYSLSEILKHAKLDQIDLDENDFSLYSTYLQSDKYPKDIANTKPQERYYAPSLDPTREEQYRNELYYFYDHYYDDYSDRKQIDRPDPPISFQEMQAINVYTGEFYKDMNEFLRGKSVLNTSTEYHSDLSRAIIVQSIMCASGLRKVHMTNIEESIRYEDVPDNKNVLPERIKAAAAQKHFTAPGFVSSSTDLSNDQYFRNKKVIYQFKGLKGVFIKAISKKPTENEFLILPTKIQLSGYDYQPQIGRHIFQASIVSEVENDPVIIINNPRDTMNAHVDILPEEGYFDLCQVCVGQDPSLLKEVRADKFLKLGRYAAICREAVNQAPSAIEFVSVKNLSEEDYFELCRHCLEKNPLLLEHIKPEYFQDKTKYKDLCKVALEKNDAVKQFIPPNLNLDFSAFVSNFKEAFKNTNSGGVKAMITFMDNLSDTIDNEEKFRLTGNKMHQIASSRIKGLHNIKAQSHIFSKGRSVAVNQLYKLFAEKNFSLETIPAAGTTDYLSRLNENLNTIKGASSSAAPMASRDMRSNTQEFRENLRLMQDNDSPDSTPRIENNSGKSTS